MNKKINTSYKYLCINYTPKTLQNGSDKEKTTEKNSLKNIVTTEKYYSQEPIGLRRRLFIYSSSK